MPSVNYAVRLRAPYESLRQSIGDWALRATHVVAYEHPEDNNIHCHILLMGVYDTDETLKNDLKKHGVGLKGAGQLSFKTSFKSPDGVKLDITTDNNMKFVTYMSKGKYEPKYVKGFDPEEIELAKSQWVTHKKRSVDERFYIEFYKHVLEKEKEFELKLNYEWIRELAISFAKRHKYGVVNLGCRRDAKMLVDTYAYETGLIKSKDLKLPFE